MTFALIRFHIPFCKNANFFKIVEQLEEPEEMKKIEQRRTQLFSLLKVLSQDQSGKPDFQGIIKAIREYLPDAFNLVHSIHVLPEGFELPDLDISWSSGMTRLPERTFTFNSIDFELAMVLMTLVYTLFNVSAQKMQSSKVSDHEACREVAHSFCEIAGILDFIGDAVWKHLDNIPLAKRPNELLSLVSLKALSCLAMAQAEEIGAWNAEEKQIKNSLVAKLFIRGSDLYKEAQQYLLQLAKNPDFPRSETGLVNEFLSAFVDIKSNLLLSAAYRHLAFDAKQNESHGVSVTYIKLAGDKIEETKKNSEGF